MNTDQLKELLKQAGEVTGRAQDCPDDNRLASYMEGGLSEQGLARFELHLADCGYCIVRVGLLSRARESGIETTVPDLVMARSRALAGSADKQTFKLNSLSSLRNATGWAAAAVVVLALGLLANMDSSNQASPEWSTPDARQPVTGQVRNLDPGALAPRVVFPPEGATVGPAELIFNWTAIPDSLYYQVRIVSDDGDLVWKQRVEGTQWEPPSGLALTPGAEYFVRVDAYLGEAKALNSDYLLFRIGIGR